MTLSPHSISTAVRRWWFDQSPAARLAAAYVVIIMIISLFFSIAVYNLSVNQLDDSLHRQYSRFRIIDDKGFISLPNPRQLDAELKAGEHRLTGELLYFNLIILVLSSGASYFLARHTLMPIEEALEAQSRFSGDASHELRTPLTAMQTQIEVALRNKRLAIADARELLGSNLEEVGKLRMLSDGLLKLARGGEVADHEVVSLEDVAVEALQRVIVSAQAKLITINNDTADVAIMGDRATLTELMVILLDNAIKYSPAKAAITVTVRRQGKTASIVVADTGMGIAAVDLPHIFDRFYRADTSRTRQTVEGYGLGLSIAKKIVEVHEGVIEASSEVGQGTKFTVRFPATRPA